MANIPLKSIKFPDLDDTYTVPSNAGELPYNKSATYPADTVGKALQNIGDSSAPAIIETATGSIASFDDGADDIPVKSLVAEIVPLQSGSGDPSPDNVRPITGWTEAEIHVADGETPHIVDNVTTISFASAGTVYGGRLDVTSGVLTVDWAGVDMGSINDWGFNSTYNVFYCYLTSPMKKPGTTNLLCQQYKPIGTTYQYLQNAQMCGTTGGEGFNVKDDRYSSADTFKTAMNGIYIYYELNTPQTYQLTPTEVKSLLKNNNIWADTGDVTVEYVADTKTFIENLVNA